LQRRTGFHQKSTSASQLSAARVAPFQAKLAWQWWIFVKSRRDAAKFAANVRICPSDQAIAAVKSTRWQQIPTRASAALQMKTAPRSR